MPNGSLDQHLFHNNRRRQHLHWETRYNIIKDVAAGLHYVHHEYERAVLHRDIKASNIMLDAGFHGRLGDFGLARVVAFDKNSFTDLGVAGTWGFIAPEYAVSHKATRQTDVYAFGVLILEVVTEKRSLGMADSTFPLLLDWVWWLHGEGRLLEAMDDEVAGTGEFDSNDATRLLLLGLACCNPNPSDRPSMVEVVQVISKSMPPPAMPLTKPAFVWPPEGYQLPLSDDSGDDEFVEADHRDSDRTNWEESECYDGLTTTGGIRSSEITKRKSRNVNERNITRDIENGV
jgi:serine/threonine protein kinase